MGRQRGRQVGRTSSGFCLTQALAAAILLFGACAPAPVVPIHFIDIRLEAGDRSWRASYLVSEGTGVREIPTGREIHVPRGAAVRLRLASRDYVSDFAIVALELRDFATPMIPADFYFVADRAGRYEVRGDELCGLPHTERARGWLVVEDAPTYTAWIRGRMKEAQG